MLKKSTSGVLNIPVKREAYFARILPPVCNEDGLSEQPAMASQ
jgi:hypothetical protein